MITTVNTLVVRRIPIFVYEHFQIRQLLGIIYSKAASNFKIVSGICKVVHKYLQPALVGVHMITLCSIVRNMLSDGAMHSSNTEHPNILWQDKQNSCEILGWRAFVLVELSLLLGI